MVFLALLLFMLCLDASESLLCSLRLASFAQYISLLFYHRLLVMYPIDSS
jgi:hypothetical protein